MWGQTRPTKPMGPLMATAAAVMREAVHTRDPPEAVDPHA